MSGKLKQTSKVPYGVGCPQGQQSSITPLGHGSRLHKVPANLHYAFAESKEPGHIMDVSASSILGKLILLWG